MKGQLDLADGVKYTYGFSDSVEDINVTHEIRMRGNVGVYSRVILSPAKVVRRSNPHKVIKGRVVYST
jgi:hypothetical protein